MFGSYLILNTALTVLSVPYMAMASELSRDRNQRSALFALKFAFGNLGALISVGGTGYYLSSANTGVERLQVMSEVSVLLACLIIFSGLTTW